MKAKYKIDEEVFYKKPIGTNQYIIRKGVIRYLKVTFPYNVEYQVYSLDGCATFTLSESEIYESQKEVLKSIQ